ncbi:MAG: nucleotide exchange factor GrpE [Deltaproteobacteria bacterium]|nr:nucleotide exchange factor GrpE [Deltaproteobacteria bacterium]
MVAFQLEIAELNQALREREHSYQAKEKELLLDFLEILDAFENLDETIQAKEADFDKTARLLAKNIRSIHRMLIRMLRARHIVRIEFPDNKARMESCKIVETQESADMENETILSILKNGYMDKQHNKVVRKAEVITVLN